MLFLVHFHISLQLEPLVPKRRHTCVGMNVSSKSGAVLCVQVETQRKMIAVSTTNTSCRGDSQGGRRSRATSPTWDKFELFVLEFNMIEIG